MSEHDDLYKIEGPASDMIKSIFPTFDVNVPMPSDTAVPGSFVQHQPTASHQSGTDSEDDQ